MDITGLHFCLFLFATYPKSSKESLDESTGTDEVKIFFSLSYPTLNGYLKGKRTYIYRKRERAEIYP